MTGKAARKDPYGEAGVDAAAEKAALGRLLVHVRATRANRLGLGEEILPVGYFASVVRVTETLGLALSTDGVGTKILLAQELGALQGIGIDCVAMNVNDVLCTGAEPISFLDYLAVEAADADLLEAIGVGLAEGARQGGVTIVGGELAQVREMITGARFPAFDLAGACVGVVPHERILDGSRLVEGDAILGVASSGPHSNGFTLIRKILRESDLDPAAPLPGERVPLGEHLLSPTLIYVRPVLEILKRGIEVHALTHITGGGLLNLLRHRAPAEYRIDSPPEPPQVFKALARAGNLEDADLYRVFNMGIGFVIILPPGAVEAARETLDRYGHESWRIGTVAASQKSRVVLPGKGLVGEEGGFRMQNAECRMRNAE